jgi:glucose-6-phosphate dehydrogenase assembly protein OpcA
LEIDLSFDMTAANERIQLVDIGSELKKLWDQEQGKDKIRACLFNLIVYVTKDEKEENYQKMVHSVIAKFPCRVILILAVDSHEELLNISVRSETLEAGENKIFCEIIQVEASNSQLNRVPFIILPHILSDLPVYLLWTQDPIKANSILPHLESLANRIIFDSKSTSDIQKFSQSVLSIMDRFHCEVGDLKWNAFKGWRNLIRSAFNHPESLICLVQSKIVRVYYNESSAQSDRNYEIEAVYFQAWLAAQLNWKFQFIEKNEGNIRIAYKRLAYDIIISLIPTEIGELPPGTLVSIEIESLRNKAHWNFKRQPETRQVFIQYSDQNCCDLPHVNFLGGPTQGKEIIQEIFYQQAGTHYRNMLQILAQIPWGEPNVRISF